MVRCACGTARGWMGSRVLAVAVFRGSECVARDFCSISSRLSSAWSVLEGLPAPACAEAVVAGRVTCSLPKPAMGGNTQRNRTLSWH